VALLLAGIDEAGYGPTLGPFCVGMSLFRIPDTDTVHTPDLWERLAAAVCRKPGRAGRPGSGGRIPIADSKRLKLANSARSVHPLVHLERGVLAFMRLRNPDLPGDDLAFFKAIGAEGTMPFCYRGDRRPIPVAMTPGEIHLSAAAVEGAACRAGVELLDLRVDLTWEPAFNDAVRERGNKADAALGALCRLLRALWERWSGGPDDGPEAHRLGIACDRLGGRVTYADVLSLMLPDARIITLEETDRRSRYILESDRPRRRAGIAFLTDGEDAHLPVALASMVAKYTRELAMARFNAFWSKRFREICGGELKPTAGYALDARRWLRDTQDLLTDEERRTLVRIA
jgi:hypothetical protein